MKLRWILIGLLLLGIMFVPLTRQVRGLKVGSKAFTESVLLGELLTQLSRSTGQTTNHLDQIGGSSQLFQALLVGDIDVYPDYTGTVQLELLSQENLSDWDEVKRFLDNQKIKVSEPLGFNNGYAIGMKRSRATELGLTKVSELSRYPDLKFGFTNEFVSRADCWPGLRTRYGLPQSDVRGMEHDLAYRQLVSGDIDAIDVYTTDAKIAALDIVLLEDDLGYFPEYQAVLLYRADLPQRFPNAFEQMSRLVGSLNEQTIMQLNYQSDYERRAEPTIAAEFLNQTFQIETVVQEQSWQARVWKYTLEHVDLVRKSLIPAIVVGILLGVVAFKRRKLGEVILSVTGIVQTIPALALLVLLLPPVAMIKLGDANTGVVTAYFALFLYSLLPIVRNTFSGLSDIEPVYLESARALGLPAASIMKKIQLPLAMRSIVSGIKIAAILNIGFATLGALIGAGGYGDPVLTGIRRFDTAEILMGAVPAALMALACQGFFEFIERLVVPKGLRLKRH